MRGILVTIKSKLNCQITEVTVGWFQEKIGSQFLKSSLASYLLSGNLTGLRWQTVASSITFCEAGPSRLFTASWTVFWLFIRSCIWDVSMNCRPQASRNLQEVRFAFNTFVLRLTIILFYYKIDCLLVGHGELVCLLFVAGCQLVLDAGHQIVVVGAPDRLLDDIQPPGRFQLDLEK